MALVGIQRRGEVPKRLGRKISENLGEKHMSKETVSEDYFLGSMGDIVCAGEERGIVSHWADSVMSKKKYLQAGYYQTHKT